ncbi:MAG: hypothetical protein KJ065_19040 [Anaerolineae bacterium]|nr:hypothetical protein [Anaerolineae bacterium]
MRDGRRTLLLLAAIFGVLLVATLLRDRSSDQVEAPTLNDLPFERVFPALADGDIQAIRLQDLADNSFLTLVRDETGQWTAPDLPGVLDQEIAALIVRTVVILPVQGIFSLAGNPDLADYGFNPDGNLLIQIVLANGTQHGIVVGGISPSGNGVYALVDSQPSMYLLERAAIAFLVAQIQAPPTA